MEAGDLERSAIDLAEVNGNGSIVANAMNVRWKDTMGTARR